MGIFSNKNKVALDQQAISTLICEGSIISGNVKAPAVARIDGEIAGDVDIAEGLILGAKGFVNGSVTTKDLIVYGTVNGNIKVQSLEIKGTGQITGDIETGTLLVEAGGVYNGRLSMASAGSVSSAKQSN